MCYLLLVGGLVNIQERIKVELVRLCHYVHESQGDMSIKIISFSASKLLLTLIWATPAYARGPLANPFLEKKLDEFMKLSQMMSCSL